MALVAAVATPASPIDLDPLGDDGGYLVELVVACRSLLWQLPSAAVIEHPAEIAAARCAHALAHTHTATERGSIAELPRWAMTQEKRRTTLGGRSPQEEIQHRDPRAARRRGGPTRDAPRRRRDRGCVLAARLRHVHDARQPRGLRARSDEVPRLGDPELLRPEHVLAGLRSGEASLDVWLRDRARTAAGAGSARTYVVVDAEQERVVGYHALTVAAVEHEHATARARKGMPRHPIPVVLLARLAVDESVQGRGIGAFLLCDAMTRTAAAAGRFGIRALLVHALHEEARAFYLRHGLEPSPTDQLHLMMLVKDIRAAIEAAGDGST